MTARSLSPWMKTLRVVYTLVWILSYYHGVTSFPADLASETVHLAYVNKQKIVGAEIDRIQTDRKSVCFSWCLENTVCQGINISYNSKSKEPINCQFFSNGTRFEQDENSVAYLRQPVGGNNSDKQKLADAVAEFLSNNPCKQSNMNLVAGELSGGNQTYLSTQYRNIYDSWYNANEIPLDNKDQAELFNIFFLTVQQAPIYHVLEYTKAAYLRTGTDPNATFESIVCNNVSVRQERSDVHFQTTDMVQVGRGDSFILTFEHWRCNGNNRHTSATVRSAPECQLWNLDRLLVDGGGSGSSVKNILSVIGNSSVTVEGVQQKGYVSHLIVTHLDEDHLGGIGTLLESHSHIFIQDTKVIIDDLFTPNTRTVVGAPISSSCANIHQAVNSYQTSTSFARANRVSGMTTEVMLKIHWHLHHTSSKYQVSSSLNHPGWSEPSGLDISFLGPNLIVLGRALRSPDMCGGGGDYYRDRAKARNAISVIFTVNAGASGRMLFTGDATNESYEKLAAQSFDVVKVAHHGSQVTNTLAMIEKFKARHYLISGKTAGSILQPGLQTLKWIAESAASPEMWLTNWDQDNSNNLYCLDRLVDHYHTPYTVSLVRAGVVSLRFVTDAGSIAAVRNGDYEVVLPRNDDGLLCPNLPNFSNSVAYGQEHNIATEQAHYAADVPAISPEYSNPFAGKNLQHSE